MTDPIFAALGVDEWAPRNPQTAPTHGYLAWPSPWTSAAAAAPWPGAASPPAATSAAASMAAAAASLAAAASSPWLQLHSHCPPPWALLAPPGALGGAPSDDDRQRQREHAGGGSSAINCGGLLDPAALRVGCPLLDEAISALLSAPAGIAFSAQVPPRSPLASRLPLERLGPAGGLPHLPPPPPRSAGRFAPRASQPAPPQPHPLTPEKVSAPRRIGTGEEALASDVRPHAGGGGGGRHRRGRRGRGGGGGGSHAATTPDATRLQEKFQ